MLFSQTKFFAADSTLDYMCSDLLSCTFEANERYDIGSSIEPAVRAPEAIAKICRKYLQS